MGTEVKKNKTRFKFHLFKTFKYRVKRDRHQPEAFWGIKNNNDIHGLIHMKYIQTWDNDDREKPFIGQLWRLIWNNLGNLNMD